MFRWIFFALLQSCLLYSFWFLRSKNRRLGSPNAEEVNEVLGIFLPRRRAECGVEYQPYGLSYHETYRAIRGTNAANSGLKAAEQTFKNRGSRRSMRFVG